MNNPWIYAAAALLLVASLVSCLPQDGRQPCDARAALPWVACP
jgi:hypothetical protein